MLLRSVEQLEGEDYIWGLIKIMNIIMSQYYNTQGRICDTDRLIKIISILDKMNRLEVLFYKGICELNGMGFKQDIRGGLNKLKIYISRVEKKDNITDQDIVFRKSAMEVYVSSVRNWPKASLGEKKQAEEYQTLLENKVNIQM